VLSTLIESLIDKKHFLQRNQIENNDKKEKEIQNNKKQIDEMKTELKLTEEEIQNKENIISQKEMILNQRNNDYETLQKQISFVKIVIENINKDSNEFNNDFKYLEKLIKDKQSNEPMISVERKNEIKRILYLKEKEKIINDCDFKIKSLNANIKLYANKIKNIKIQIDNLLSGASIGNKKFYVEQTSSTIIKVNYILFLFNILLIIIYFTMKQIV
jgi:DNA repair exonuclease SbcCD ATPase subunit